MGGRQGAMEPFSGGGVTVQALWPAFYPLGGRNADGKIAIFHPDSLNAPDSNLAVCIDHNHFPEAQEIFSYLNPWLHGMVSP